MKTKIRSQTIALAALAILGHKSAHSFPMGPVIADPTIMKKENRFTHENFKLHQQLCFKI